MIFLSFQGKNKILYLFIYKSLGLQLLTLKSRKSLFHEWWATTWILIITSIIKMSTEVRKVKLLRNMLGTLLVETAITIIIIAIKKKFLNGILKLSVAMLLRIFICSSWKQHLQKNRYKRFWTDSNRPFQKYNHLIVSIIF